MWNNEKLNQYLNGNKNIIPAMTNVSNNIQNLIIKCISLEQSERPTIEMIKPCLLKEFVLKYYLEPYITQYTINIKETDINSYIYENIVIRIQNNKQIKTLFKEMFDYKTFFFRNHVEKKRMACMIDMGTLGDDDDDSDNDTSNEIENNDTYSLIELLQLFASSNEPFSLLKLGNLYYNGTEVKQDYKKAREYFELAAQQHNPQAMYKLGMIYMNGYGVERDYSIAKNYFLTSPQYNYISSYTMLGILYMNGYGVEKNYELGRRYFEYAAEHNHPWAQLNLGKVYFFGIGVKKNYKLALKYFEESANHQNPEAMFFLGYIYRHGYGIEKDYLIAKNYFEMGAELNNDDAQYNLGMLYLKGIGVSKDISQAMHYFRLAEKNGNIHVLNTLGMIYRDGIIIQPKDYLRAKYYFEKAANKNDSNGFFYLGCLYSDESWNQHDYSKARYYLELSAKLNNQFAFLALGNIYFKGIGIEKDYVKAKRYFEFSSYFNNLEAFFNLGIIYLNGNGVKIDKFKAKHYFELSTQLKNPNGYFFLGNLFYIGDLFDIDIKKAIDYYMKSIKIKKEEMLFRDISNQEINYSLTVNNDFRYHSNNNLGLIYLFFFQDIKNASKYLKEAGSTNYSFAQNNFGLLNQLYLNNNEEAIYMFEKSMKNKFALAAFNIGLIKEKEEKIDESIDFYKKASEYEEEGPTNTINTIYIDKQLEISKIFIICLTNLKLTAYYFQRNELKESKQFFIKSFSKLKINDKDLSYNFKFILHKGDEENSFKYLKTFIFNFPFFNLKNQPNINFDDFQSPSDSNDDDNDSDNNDEDDKSDSLLEYGIDKIQSIFKINNKLENTTKNNNELIKENLLEEKTIFKNNKDFDSSSDPEDIFENNEYDPVIKKLVFFDQSELFDIVVKDKKLKEIFIDQIKEIINLMEKILFTPPYNILFGRINIAKLSENDKTLAKDIDSYFYEGFGIDQSLKFLE